MRTPVLLAALLLAAAGCSSPGDGGGPARPAGYAFGPASTPADAPDGFGTEPSLLAAADGALYFTSVLGSATARGDGLWKSADGGATWAYLGKPDHPFGGGDSDIDELPGGALLLTGQWRPAAVPANPVVGSPYVTGGESVARSDDGGATWTMFPTAGYLPAADRQWLAVDGQVAYLAFNVAATGLEVGRSPDGGRTWLPPTLVPQSTDPLPSGPNGIAGDLAVDSGGRLFIPYGPGPGGGHVQRVFRSADGAQTFDELTVHAVPEGAAEASGAIFSTLALDAADNLYLAWSETVPDGGMAVFLSLSTDHGDSWSEPMRVTPPGTTAVFPWAVAGAAGRVAVAAYATENLTLPDDAPDGTLWHPVVWFSQDALAEAPAFVGARATAAPNHAGPICTGGTVCAAGRTLGDFFEAAVLPDGRVAVAFADDTAEPRVNRVAVQSAGPRLLG